MCPKTKSEGQESRESTEDAKGKHDYLNCSITSLTADINHSPSKFQIHCTDCLRVEQF